METPNFTALMVGLLGLATAAITNIDKLQAFWQSAFKPDSSPLLGKWTGIFQEYQTETGRVAVSNEIVKVALRGGEITGAIETSAGKPRSWNASGKAIQNDELLVLSYWTTDESRPSLGAYVLQFHDKDTYLGYWLGYDPDVNKIVANPYVLTRDSEMHATETFKDFLARPPSTH